MVIARRQENPIFETVQLVVYSHAVVISRYRKWCMYDKSTRLRPSVCRPCRIDSRMQRILLRIICHHRRATIVGIANCYNSDNPDSVFKNTVLDALLRMGLRSRRLRHIPALTARHRVQRLQRALEHRNWTMKKGRKLYSHVFWSITSTIACKYADFVAKCARSQPSLPDAQLFVDESVKALLSCGRCAYGPH